MMVVGTDSVRLATLLTVALASAHFLTDAQQLRQMSAAATSSPAPSSAAPYWHRPGCHQVGHTRTISIPGCVKFNLSTNACRGFCMSFSIPAAEDIGPAGAGALLDRELAGDLVEGGVVEATGPVASQPDELARRMKKGARLAGRTQLAWVGDGGGAAKGAASRERLHELVHLVGSKSPLAGAIGDTSDKRDVVSVGQCCNMMETEDVVVNLRCGLNKTRKLVFKSAKTCECFFCKHVQ